jgi:hypothetical protein
MVVALILAGLDTLVLRPGLGAPEELTNLGMIVGGGGIRGWWRMGGGAWTRALQWACLAGPWAWQAIYAVSVAGSVAGLIGVWRLAARLGGAPASAWALVMALGSPFFFLQARTTFAYVLAPALLLGLVLGLRHAQGRAVSGLLGLAAALAWLDYEGWALALPALALAWASAPRGGRAQGLWVAGGLAAGLALVLALSAPYSGDWWVHRGQALAAGGGPAWSNLKSYFFGGEAPLAMGLEQWPAIPWMAWPGLLAGLWEAPAWLWAWAGVGMLGSLWPGPWQEPNRAIVAWPAFLLIAGLGSARLWRRCPPRAQGPILGLALLASPLLGWSVFRAAEARWDGAVHGYSRRLTAAATFLRQRGLSSPLSVDTRLDPLGGPFLRRLLGPSPAGLSEAWFLVPDAWADPGDARWGRWERVQGPAAGPPLWLLRPAAALRPWLERQAGFEAALGALTLAPERGRLERLRGAGPTAQDAWAWSRWHGEQLKAALAQGVAGPQDVLPLLDGPCLELHALEAVADAYGGLQPAVAEAARARLAALAHPGARWRLAFGSRP